MPVIRRWSPASANSSCWRPNAPNAGEPAGDRDGATPERWSGRSSFRDLLAVFTENAGGDHHRLADDRHADIAREVQQHLDQLVLVPALAQRHPQVQREFGLTAGAGVG